MPQYTETTTVRALAAQRWEPWKRLSLDSCISYPLYCLRIIFALTLSGYMDEFQREVPGKGLYK